MTDGPRITAARLRIVTKDGEIVPNQPAKRGRKPRMPKIGSEFAPVTPERLCDRRYDFVYPPRTRLYLFIVMRSKRGTAPFPLTNDLTAKLGIDRHHKFDYLRDLEQHGLVVMTRMRRAAPWVSAEG